MKQRTIIICTILYTIYSGFAGVGVYYTYCMVKSGGLTIIAERPEDLNVRIEVEDEQTIKDATRAIAMSETKTMKRGGK